MPAVLGQMESKTMTLMKRYQDAACENARACAGDTMTRDEMLAFVLERAAGAREPAQHTHIECQCPDLSHRKPEYEQGCFCPECAAVVAVERGLEATDTEPEADGPEDVRFCERCGLLITVEIDAAIAEDELSHWEDRGATCSGSLLDSPDHWREFQLCVEFIADEHLPRVEALIREHKEAP